MPNEEDRIVRIEINNLIDTYCRRCTANVLRDCSQCQECDIFPEIRALGDSLLTGWRGRDIEELLKKGEALSISDIRRLLWLGATKVDIAAALGTYYKDKKFGKLMRENRLRHRDLIEDGYLVPSGNDEYMGIFDMYTDEMRRKVYKQ